MNLQSAISLSTLVICLFIFGINDQYMAKHFGGNHKINLPPNTKLDQFNWDGSNIWYLTRPMNSLDSAETYHYVEKSTFGFFEGKVTVTEHKESVTPIDDQGQAIKNYYNKNNPL